MKQIKKTRKFNKKGFTLLEVVVASGVAATLLALLVMLFTNFRASYSKGEASGILMQEAALFIARLRTDLNNSVLVQNNLDLGFEDQLHSSANQLVFSIYNSDKGIIQPVIYELHETQKGKVITRKEGNGKGVTIIKNHVASLSWPITLDTYDTKPVPTKRIRIELDISLESTTQKDKIYNLKTNIFPVRLNKQLN